MPKKSEAKPATPSVRAPATILQPAPPKARPAGAPKTPEERHLAGDYRVIHGTLMVPRPVSERLGPDGQIDRMIPPQVAAEMGAVVRLDDYDAARAVDAGVVEKADVPLDQSRMGQVWQPPKVERNYYANG